MGGYKFRPYIGKTLAIPRAVFLNYNLNAADVNHELQFVVEVNVCH